MSREQTGRIGQRHELVAQRVVQQGRELIRGGSPGGEQVGAPDVADEERVAGENAVGDGVVRVLVDDDADRLGCVSRRFPYLEGHLPKRDTLAIPQRTR